MCWCVGVLVCWCVFAAVMRGGLGFGTLMSALYLLAFGYPVHSLLGTLERCLDGDSLAAIIGTNGSGKSTLLKNVGGSVASTAWSFYMPHRHDEFPRIM